MQNTKENLAKQLQNPRRSDFTHRDKVSEQKFLRKRIRALKRKLDGMSACDDEHPMYRAGFNELMVIFQRELDALLK